MTTNQFWHCLIGLPEYVNNPFFSMPSADGAGFDDIKTLGQQLFTLFCGSSDNLQLNVHPPAGVAQGERHLPKLLVQHMKPLVYFDGST